VSGTAGELDALLRDFGVAEPLRARMVRFGELLLAANRQTNLTGAKTAADLAPHLLDSATVAPYLQEPYLDVGSGGGLPALPAMMVAGIGGTLIEASRKKARFLEDAVAALGLTASVLTMRAEGAGRDPALRATFASATARAVAHASTVAEYVLPMLRTGGVAILQRGTMEPRESAALVDAALMLGGRVEAEHPVGDRRRIVLVRKVEPTPERFPRRAGVPEKRPLCA
jgi:16S rRNA (guanine527-N7)-methyltransferase